MSTKQRTEIVPAFSDAVAAELRAAINNNAPTNQTVFSSLLLLMGLLDRGPPTQCPNFTRLGCIMGRLVS
jgi:hypothetical protein